MDGNVVGDKQTHLGRIRGDQRHTQGRLRHTFQPLLDDQMGEGLVHSDGDLGPIGGEPFRDGQTSLRANNPLGSRAALEDAAMIARRRWPLKKRSAVLLRFRPGLV